MMNFGAFAMTETGILGSKKFGVAGMTKIIQPKGTMADLPPPSYATVTVSRIVIA